MTANETLLTLLDELDDQLFYDEEIDTDPATERAILRHREVD